MKKLLIIISIVIFSISLFGICSAGMVILGWTANPELHLAGYKVYYDIDTGSPYDGTIDMDGMAQGNTPIVYWLNGKRPPGNITDYELEDNSDPEAVIHIIDTSKQWFFVITAFDTEGNESGYSNEVNTIDDIPEPYPPETPPSKIYNIRALGTVVVEDVNNASGYSNEPPLPEVVQNIRVVKQ